MSKVEDKQEPLSSVSCGSGSWGGQCLSLADYVMGTGPRGARPPPKVVRVAYPRGRSPSRSAILSARRFASGTPPRWMPIR
jgi:hypothetical protein